MVNYASYGIGGIASQIHYASLAGLEILRNGGNAFDAAITISSILSVLLPHTGGIGGDGFLLAMDSSGELIAYNGSGRSPKRFPVDKYLEIKPIRGPLTITVPGLVDLWGWIQENYASMDLNDLLRPAISLAENGFYVQEQLSKAIINSYKELIHYSSWAKTFGSLKKGDHVKFRHLARVLRIIGRRGSREFYEGKLAEEIVEKLSEQGVLIDYEDFSNHYGEMVKPIKMYYNDYELYELPPNTQGITTLELLKLIELSELNKKKFNDENRIIEFFKLSIIAYNDRDTYISDPGFYRVDEDFLLSGNRLKSLIDRKLSITMNSLKADTTFFVVGDRNGNIVGFIQSIFYPFGSGIVVNEIPFQNRGYGFAKVKGLPNTPAPFKRPLHTLSILLAEHDREGIYVIGCAGGHLRPQIHSEILMNIVDYGMSLSEAIDAPRYMLLEFINGEIKKGIVEIDLGIKASHKYIDIVDAKTPRTGIVHALRYSKDRIYEFVADNRGGGEAIPVF